MQDDQLEPFVTVEEAMTFVANVKLSTKISEEDKIETVSIMNATFVPVIPYRRNASNC